MAPSSKSISHVPNPLPPKDSKKAIPLPLSRLTQNGLYIVIHLRIGVESDDFHWGLYLHDTGLVGGTKYQIEKVGLIWRLGHNVTAAATTSVSLIGLVRVADIATTDRSMVGNVIKQEDEVFHQIPGMNDKAYVMRACERLKTAGQINFPTWTELEEEILMFGNNHITGAWNNAQPRALGFSRVCGLSA